MFENAVSRLELVAKLANSVEAGVLRSDPVAGVFRLPAVEEFFFKDAVRSTLLSLGGADCRTAAVLG